MLGGSPEKVIDSHSAACAVVADGNLLVLTSWRDETNGKNRLLSAGRRHVHPEVKDVPGVRRNVVVASGCTQDTPVPGELLICPEFREFSLCC
jgi:hypothetical protein